MADIYKVQCVWEGLTGLPGVNTFYQSDLPTDLTPFQTFYNAIGGGIPTAVTIPIPNSGVVVEEETGTLTSGWSADAVANAEPSGGGDHAGGVGACITWNTLAIVRGRRVKGRSFIVPCVGAVFDTDGTLDESYRSTLATAAATLINELANTLVVWSRPRPDLTGQAYQVLNATVADKAAILRSRRD